MTGSDPHDSACELLSAIKDQIDGLETLLAEVNGHWVYEDGLYRFYHQSYKVYRLQETTLRIVEALRAVAAERDLNPWFQTIVDEGTNKQFSADHNQRWLLETRPIIEAFLHTRYFLEMMCKYGRELEEPPSPMPSGWASVLYLYGLR